MRHFCPFILRPGKYYKIGVVRYNSAQRF